MKQFKRIRQRTSSPIGEEDLYRDVKEKFNDKS
jgi:hypothetical protein